MSNLKIDQEEFNRKAQHILETVVKPQVERYEKAKAEKQMATWNKEKQNGEEIIMTNNNPDNTMTTMSPMDVENERFFKTEASDYNPAVREKNQPEPYNPNRPALVTMTFKFNQEENCVDGGEGETLIVEAKSSLGIDGDGGAFYVLKTDQWAISYIDDLVVMLRRIEAAVNATKPTSIHVK